LDTQLGDNIPRKGVLFMSKDKIRPVVVKRALASVVTTGRGGRFSALRKAQAALRLLRGEDLELLRRELEVVASTLSLWREQFLAAGRKALKGNAGQSDARDEQISRLKKKVGERFNAGECQCAGTPCGKNSLAYFPRSR
jgi:transposase-like protein